MKKFFIRAVFLCDSKKNIYENLLTFLLQVGFFLNSGTPIIIFSMGVSIYLILSKCFIVVKSGIRNYIDLGHTCCSINRLSTYSPFNSHFKYFYCFNTHIISPNTYVSLIYSQDCSTVVIGILKSKDTNVSSIMYNFYYWV